jgi:hypothetical protein
MTNPRERFLLTLIYLLQKENDCLYSVLSEWDADKSCFVQMNQAEILRAAIEALEHSL